MFFAVDFDSLLFSSPDIGNKAAVFQVYKIRAFNQSQAFVLIAKCKTFFQHHLQIFYFKHQSYMHIITPQYLQKIKKLQHHNLNI